MRSRALMRAWNPQLGQTMRLSRTSAIFAWAWHLRHSHSGFTGSLLRRSISTVTFMGAEAGRSC